MNDVITADKVRPVQSGRTSNVIPTVPKRERWKYTVFKVLHNYVTDYPMIINNYLSFIIIMNELIAITNSYTVYKLI